MHTTKHHHGFCSIVPPYVLRAIAEHGRRGLRSAAARTLAHDEALRRLRALRAPGRSVPPAAPDDDGPHKDRTVSDAANTMRLPGRTVRTEGDAPAGDVAVDEAYDGTGDTFDFFWDVFERDSIDGAGMALLSTVHYGQGYDNAFWDGSQMIFGDGDGTIFNRFTISLDVIGHELAHGVTETLAGLRYEGQPGALNESMSDVFGSLVKQRARGQTAAEADWLIGEGLLAEGVDGVALRSMADPGTAYDDERLGGKDPQPATMADYVETDDDDGGVHINSGIPNRAFYLAATAFGGAAWEQAGRIWYAALSDPTLKPTSTFNAFATRTSTNAAALLGAEAQRIVKAAWKGVGITAR
ncbi:MAG: M4 family metallopeptidase [Ilumatobacteraceae bacterium]